MGFTWDLINNASVPVISLGKTHAFVQSQRKFTLRPFVLAVLNFSKRCLYNSTYFTRAYFI